jgi:hypothetical protein
MALSQGPLVPALGPTNVGVLVDLDNLGDRDGLGANSAAQSGKSLPKRASISARRASMMASRSLKALSPGDPIPYPSAAWAATVMVRALFGLSGSRASLHPIQPAEKEANVVRHFFRSEVARCHTQRCADAVDEVNVVDPRDVFGFLLHAGRIDDFRAGAVPAGTSYDDLLRLSVAPMSRLKSTAASSARDARTAPSAQANCDIARSSGSIGSDCDPVNELSSPPCEGEIFRQN